jgi:diapolycopene oxygenase
MGGGVGGLSAAIHCRNAGFEVTLLEQNALGGKAAQIEVSGFRLDPGPSIIILPEIYRNLFRRCGRDPDDYIKFRRLDPITRVFQEGTSGWLDIPAQLSEALSLAKTISSKDAESLKSLCDLMGRIEPHLYKSVFRRPVHSPLQLLSPDLIAMGRHFAGSGTYKEYVDRNFESPFFRAFFYGFPAYSGQSYHTRSMSGLLIPYFMLVGGVYYPEGGVAAIPKALERLARELGVVFRVGERVRSISSSGTRISALETDNGEKVVADHYVSNVDRISTQALLGRQTSAHPSFSYFTVHWGLRRQLPNLAHHMLLIPKNFEAGFDALYRDRKFPDPPIVYLNVTSDSDNTVAPPGCTNLFAVVTSPACEPDIDWSAETIKARQAVQSMLSRFGLSFSPEDIVFERIQTPVYFQSEHANFKGSLYGPDETERLFGGLFPLKCKDDWFRNLFYAGGSVQPGAGLPMVTLSGKFVADLIAGADSR